MARRRSGAGWLVAGLVALFALSGSSSNEAPKPQEAPAPPAPGAEEPETQPAEEPKKGPKQEDPQKKVPTQIIPKRRPNFTEAELFEAKKDYRKKREQLQELEDEFASNKSEVPINTLLREINQLEIEIDAMEKKFGKLNLL